MNCLDKMYREIEEIYKKEKEEKYINENIKKKIQSTPTITERIPTDFISKVVLPETGIVKKYFDINKSKEFIKYIFIKFYVFNKEYIYSDEFNKFISELDNELSSTENILEVLRKFEDKFSIILENSQMLDDDIYSYFTNVYNCLFKDEKGYYAIIIGNKYNNVQKPIGLNDNQAKKFIKQEIEALVENYKSLFKNEKEINIFLNNLKAKINKYTGMIEQLQINCEDRIFDFLSSKGILKDAFNDTLSSFNFKLLRQNKLYYNEKQFNEYSEFKKIEFRY